MILRYGQDVHVHSLTVSLGPCPCPAALLGTTASLLPGRALCPKLTYAQALN